MKKFATVVAALGVMAGLTVSALPSASAATDVTVLGATPAPTDEPEPTTGATTSVSGALEVSLDGEDVVGPAKLALCQASCLDSSCTIVSSSTGCSFFPSHSPFTRADLKIGISHVLPPFTSLSRLPSSSLHTTPP